MTGHALSLCGVVAVALFAAASAGVCRAAEADAGATATPAPTAQQLLDDVVAQLPRESLDIRGDMILRKRRGVVLSELRFRMELQWGAEPPTARYTIQDAFGRDLEQLSLTHDKKGAPSFRYAAGEKLALAPLPDLSQAVQGTDLSWMDLTLAFLWWKGGAIKEQDSIRGRDCFVVEVPAPKGQGGQYAAVRLWIDEKYHLLLQAEGLDDRDRRVRILWVKSIRKINERWMVKDFEIQASPEHRTKLVVREVNGEQAGPQEEDSGDTDIVTPTPVETPQLQPLQP